MALRNQRALEHGFHRKRLDYRNENALEARFASVQEGHGGAIFDTDCRQNILHIKRDGRLRVPMQGVNFKLK
jgi:hypothetical protein